MNERPSNPAPKPVDEALLLDWIDGRLTPEAQERLEAASGRSGLRRRIAQMQANARALRSLGEEQAPAGLRERVLAALERDALVAMEHNGKADTPIAFADHVAVRGSSRWASRGPAMALAAGLVLLVAGGVYWSVLLFDHAKPNPRRTDSTGPIAAVTPREAATGPGPIDTLPTDAAPTIMADAGASRVAAAAEAFVGPPRPPMTAARAVELAGEGRLAVRVYTNDTQGLRHVEAVGAGKSGHDWSLRKALPPAVTLALAGEGASSDLVMASSREPAAALIAPLLGPNAAFTMPRADDPLRHVRGAYVLDVPAAPEAFERVEALLAESLDGRLELEELPAPVELTPTTPERVVWWTQPPAEWVPRVTVPVIVERGE